MSNRTVIGIFGAIFVGISVYVVRLLVGGLHVDQMFRIAVSLLPFMMIVVIASRRHWLTFGLAFWMISMRIPVLLFDSMTVGFIMMMMIAGIYVMERLVTRERFLKVEDWQSALLLVAGAIILTRLLLDRPGSARLGGVGGLRHAVSYSTAAPLFFLMNQLGREPFAPRKVLRGIVILSLLMLLWRGIWRFLVVQPMPFYFGWFEGGAWFLLPLLLALLLHRVRRGVTPMPVAVLFSAFIVALSILSPFRSRIYFSVASISAVFWSFGYRRRLFLWLVILFCMAIPILTVMPKTMVPVVARRALSTILPYDRGDARGLEDRGILVSGEFGWTSDFRRSIIEMAVRNIQQSPWFGQGWAFSSEELIWASAFQGANWAASSLVTAGDYHNSLVTVAVKCGIPAALFLGVALFSMLWRAGMRTNEGKDGDFQVLYAGMVGTVVIIFGQMLMNGGAQDLQAVCAMLGFLCAVRHEVPTDPAKGGADDAA